MLLCGISSAASAQLYISISLYHLWYKYLFLFEKYNKYNFFHLFIGKKNILLIVENKQKIIITRLKQPIHLKTNKKCSAFLNFIFQLLLLPSQSNQSNGCRTATIDVNDGSLVEEWFFLQEYTHQLFQIKYYI